MTSSSVRERIIAALRAVNIVLPPAAVVANVSTDVLVEARFGISVPICEYLCFSCLPGLLDQHQTPGRASSKMKTRIHTDEHRYTQMKDKKEERQKLHAIEKAK